MRKIKCDLDTVKSKIKELKGAPVRMKVNRGRKKIIRFNAVIEDVYPAVFIVKLENPTTNVDRASYSYSDVLCGDVKMSPIRQEATQNI